MQSRREPDDQQLGVSLAERRRGAVEIIGKSLAIVVAKLRQTRAEPAINGGFGRNFGGAGRGGLCSLGAGCGFYGHG